MGKFDTNRVLLVNDPNSPRLRPDVAKEIGLNESIVFLQLEYLIAISDHEHDNRKWTYQSLKALQEMFPFWSHMTIQRAIKSLEQQKLIIIGNYNKRKNDRTQWFALDLEGIGKLESVTLISESISQSVKSISQPVKSISQPVTTLPETTTEITTKTTKTDKPPTPEAIKVFRQNAHRYPPKSWYEKITDAVGEDPADLEFWGKVVFGYIGSGWNPGNVQNMLNFYNERNVPNGNGKASNSHWTPSQDPDTNRELHAAHARSIARWGTQLEEG